MAAVDVCVVAWLAWGMVVGLLGDIWGGSVFVWIDFGMFCVGLGMLRKIELGPIWAGFIHTPLVNYPFSRSLIPWGILWGDR